MSTRDLDDIGRDFMTRMGAGVGADPRLWFPRLYLHQLE